MLGNNSLNHSTVCKQTNTGLFKNNVANYLLVFQSYVFNINVNKCEQANDYELFVLHRNTWNFLSVCKQMIRIRQKIFKPFYYAQTNKIWIL